MPSQTRLASAMTELLRLFQLALFNLHIFEFARLEHLAALEAFHKFGVFFASDYPYARMFALGRVVLHRRRLDRAGCGHRFRTLAFPGPNAPSRLAPELAYFYRP